MLHVFIINSFAAEGKYTDGIRERLAAIPDFEYLVFNSEYAGHEGELANQIYEMFQGEKIRFYSCGGSGTFRNIFNAVPDISNVEFAEVNCGLTNDFLKCFGEAAEQFKELENLINGRVMKLDYIETNMGRVHNTVSMGIDVDVGKAVDVLKDFSYITGFMPNKLAAIWALLLSRPQKLELIVDGERHKGDYLEIMVGNGSTLGGIFKVAEDSVPTDNRLDYVAIPKAKNFVKKCKAFKDQMSKDLSLKKRCSETGQCEEFFIKAVNGQTISVDLDGEIMDCEFIKGRVIHSGMKFVVPEGLYRLTESEADEHGQH